jgi:hypothetical protein
MDIFFKPQDGFPTINSSSSMAAGITSNVLQKAFAKRISTGSPSVWENTSVKALVR